MLDGADDLAAVGLHYCCSIPFEGVAERIVDGQKEPAVAALLDNRGSGALRKTIGIERPVDAVRRARLAREVGHRRGGKDHELVFLLCICWTARATPEFGMSRTTSTLSTSYHRRTSAAPTSGLFWWSPPTT